MDQVYPQMHVLPGEEKVWVSPSNPSCHLRTLLPPELSENSGLLPDKNGWWTHNDSGGKPALYLVDTLTGAVIREVIIRNAENHDWEELAMDSGFLYIGDFGNNKGNRTDLAVYKIRRKDLCSDDPGNVTAEKIFFSWGDQEQVTESKRDHDFDCEAMVCVRDDLILFTKNWKDRKTRMYRLSKSPGHYRILPLDILDAEGLVTSADFDPVNHRLVLAGYQNYLPFVIVADDFDGRLFPDQGITRYLLPDLKDAQTEGIIWYGKGLLLSTEKTDVFPPSVYFISMPVQ
ncbi:MAG: hypothetical protein JW861_03945 [Bacteroidales bacterium]|nr:hypothetical protein [Bacteroidales bacterium]